METEIQKIRSLKDKQGVLDNNILNDFTELGCIHLLNQVFSAVYVPQSILDKEATLEEIREGLDLLEYRPISTKTADSLVFLLQITEERPGLTECDAECITLAKENMIYCTSNEKRVLNTCKDYNIDCTGTIGILCCAYEYDLLDKVSFAMLMNKLFSPSCSAHLSKSLRTRVFKYYDLSNEVCCISDTV